jgi:hypothetical protein
LALGIDTHINEEWQMSILKPANILKSLNLVAEEDRNQTDPFKAAKQKLIQNLEPQLKCAEAMVKGETYMQARIETVEDNGVKVRKSINRPIRHWYWRDGEGKFGFKSEF